MVTSTVGPVGLLSRHTSSGSVYYTFDTHSSVCQRLSSTGSILSTQTFDAYGSRLSTDGNTDPCAGYQGRNGYYADWETGTATSALELLTYRYYDPSAGRFLTRDPVGYKGGANPYEYVNNQPNGGGDATGAGEGFGWLGGAAGACAGAILGIWGTTPTNDTCNSDYNDCKKKGDCAAEALSGIVAVGVTAGILWLFPILDPFPTVVEGCAEGLLSGLGHLAVEQSCDSLKGCPEKSNDCAKWGIIFDTLAGCFSGYIGGLLKGAGVEGIVLQALEGGVEAVLAADGITLEAGCEWAAH